ncbi:putative reverse transcriptase domain-containing protein, partial [Tanacetum coccineum]
LLEQAPRPSGYVPDPMELEDHVPMYIPEPQHPEDIVPAEDEALIEPYITKSSYGSEESYNTIHISSSSRIADIPKVDTPSWKRLLLTAPTPRVEVGESSATATARQPGSTMAHRVDHSFVDTVDTRVRDTEKRTMAAVEVVNLREDRAAVRVEIEILRREMLAYEQESIETRQTLARSEAYSRALEARIRVLETQAYRNEWQRPRRIGLLSEAYIRALEAQIRVLETQAYRHECQCQDADDRAIEHIIRTQALKAGARVETLEDTARDANMNGADSHNSGTGVRRNERATCECTYPDFMKCQPLNFKGTEGVELTQWIEKMETVFRISNCSVENQIKFSTCTLLGNALTWWNSHIRTFGNDIAYAMTWTKLKKKITDKNWHCCVVECFLKNLTRLRNMSMAYPTEMAIEVMDKIIHTFADRQSENKRKPDNNQQPQQHHQNKRSTTNANNANHQRGTGSGQKPTCFKCGVQGHFKRECPKLKTNNNRGNQVRGGNALAKVYAVGHVGTNPDSNVMTGTFLLNNRYASILFDTGGDRSFVSTVFSSQIDITPTALHYYYDVKLADGRIIRLNTILRGCTLNILNHPFNIDLMPIELGSFDAIIGLDWLVKYQEIIVCAEKSFVSLGEMKLQSFTVTEATGET